jgi:FtsP/CotA-like multicopper oxidase with cupredoxin domain
MIRPASRQLLALSCLAAFALPALAQEHSHAKRGKAVFITRAPGPAILVNESHAPNTVEVTIVAEPVKLTIIPGTTTGSYAYNGRVPGPTLEAYEGDKVIVHFINRLPESTTIHWHGLHIPNASDGSPLHPVAPGKSFDYVFTVEKGVAGTYWYHPHPDQVTGEQIGMGLFGGLIIRSRNDPLPKSIAEKVIILSDNRFRPDGTIDFADPASPQGGIDFENGRECMHLFVNGEMMPAMACDQCIGGACVPPGDSRPDITPRGKRRRIVRASGRGEGHTRCEQRAGRAARARNWRTGKCDCPADTPLRPVRNADAAA